jgi:hypothetical protein
MRSLNLGLSMLCAVLVTAVACGTPEEEVPGGNTGARAGTGGSKSGEGSGAKAGKGGTGNTGNDGDGGDDTSSMAGGPPIAQPDDCAGAWEGTVPEPSVECDLDNLEDSGQTLSGDIDSNRTLVSGKTYKLSGPTRVTPGTTLTIEPCVKVIGQSPSSVLVIMAGEYDGAPGSVPGPGAKIEAKGEADAPIVFTSSQPVGSRAPGDWGGLIILGNAIHNLAPRTNDVVTRPTIEGLTAVEPYGWDTHEFNEESSGTLSYVRIEYASYEVQAAEETNGLTFGAVGSGTTVNHIMVSNSNDDCFEWFGGTVNATHLIAYNCDDDMFDTDRGYTGRVQFAFGRQIEGTLETDSNGFEMDNGYDVSSTPRTLAEWSNVTLCGTAEEPVSGTTAPRVGMALRSAVGGAISNSLITGFDNGAFFVRDLPVLNRPLITVTHSSAFDNSALYEANNHVESPTWFQDQEGNSIERPEGMCDCFADPPTPFPLTQVPGGAPGDQFTDPDASYQGAFADAAPESNWMLGKWVDWSNE